MNRAKRSVPAVAVEMMEPRTLRAATPAGPEFR